MSSEHMRRADELWIKVQQSEIQAQRTKTKVDRALFWAAKWENGQRDGMFEASQYAAHDRCVVLANEVERLRKVLQQVHVCLGYPDDTNIKKIERVVREALDGVIDFDGGEDGST